MKKIIASLLTVLFLFSVVATAPAADNVPAVTAQSVAAKPGESVTVKLILSDNPGVSGLVLTLKYDANALTQATVANGALFENMESGLNLVFTSSSDVTADGILATITFTVSENAVGSYPVSIIIRETSNSNFEDVDFAAVSGAVNVANGNVFSVRVNGEEKLVKPGDILNISARTGYTERGLKYRFDRWTAVYETGEDASDVVSDSSRANTTAKIPDRSVGINAQYYALGDVDGNGRINTKDVIKIMRIRVGFEAPDEIFFRADYNEDGRVNNKDILMMLLDIVNGVIE